VIKNNQ